MALLDPRANIGLIDAALRSIGPAEQHVVRLDASGTITDENFEYSDLIKGGPLGRCVGAIVEKDGSPLVYLAAVPIEAPETGRQLAQLLGNRGETAVLLDVHRNSDDRMLARAWPCSLDVTKAKELDLGNAIDAQSVLGDLQEGLWGRDSNTHQEQRLRDLLVKSVDKVAKAMLNKSPAGP